MGPECTSPTGRNSTEPSDLLRFLARCPTWTPPGMFEAPRCRPTPTSPTPTLPTLPALGATWLRPSQIGLSPSHLQPIHQVTQAPAQHPPATIPRLWPLETLEQGARSSPGSSTGILRLER